MILSNISINKKNNKQRTANTGFASGELRCKFGTLCFVSSSVLVDSLVLRNPPERKARKRWWQFYNDTQKHQNSIVGQENK